MRRILTSLGVFALLALVAAPAMARPNGPNGRGSDARRGWVADQSYGDLRVERVAPAPYIAPRHLVRARAYRSQYVSQKASLMRQIQAERRLIRSLRTAPVRRHVRARANFRKIQAAERRLARLEQRLSTLEMRYGTRLGQLLSPAAVRFFRVTFG